LAPRQFRDALSEQKSVYFSARIRHGPHDLASSHPGPWPIVSLSSNLLNTTKPIIEIGMDVGYTSPSHFAHVFRKETGISPHEYRERTLGDVPTEDFSRIATG
jgi:AraC-like DNA-binding protein